MYIAQHDWASINALLRGLIYSDTKKSTHTVAEGEGAQGITGNWTMMVGWTKGCKCKDLPVCTPERRQYVHGHGFRQGTNAVPAPWGQAGPSQCSTEEENTEICSFFIFPPCLRELLGYFTVYLSSLSFVVCFAGLLWLLVVYRHTQKRLHLKVMLPA